MFPLDSDTRGVRFYNLTAEVSNDRIHLSGSYSASNLIPVLLFSVGVPWIEPCVKHVCCLWDVAERYRDHDLMTALGPTCNENANLTGRDLMKGNRVGAATQWDVSTMIHPSFVAMLFLCLAPTFYMYHEILPMQWIDTATVHWRSSWYGQPCHTVIYPSGQPVCIYCSNSKPDNAVFVFSANWFATFQCQWVCKPGFVGPNCDVAMDLAMYAGGGAVAAACVVSLAVCAVYGPRRRVAEEAKTEAAASLLQPPKFTAPAMQRSEMIVFKENAAMPEIRIKLL